MKNNIIIEGTDGVGKTSTNVVKSFRRKVTTVNYIL